MFELSNEVKVATEKTVELIARHERGDIITFEAIEKATGLTRYGEGWNSTIQRTRKKVLRDRAIAVWPERNVGYKLLTKDEQLVKLPLERQRRAARQLTRSIQAVEAIPVGSLSLHQQNIQAMQRQALRLRRRTIRSGIRKSLLEGRKQESVPRRPVQQLQKSKAI